MYTWGFVLKNDYSYENVPDRYIYTSNFHR